jgi:hypothetical protein
MNPLSDRAKQLIPQARIVSFAGWHDLDPAVRDRFQTADDEGRYLTDEDLQAIAPSVPTAAISTVQQLRDHAADIVDEARAEVLARFPGILEPGGGLYPAFRADACWRDFWHFLRCITYGIAGQQSDYTSPAGLEAMEQLYDELKVPLPAMVEGLKGIKQASFSRFSEEDQAALAPYFDHLIARLSAYVA